MQLPTLLINFVRNVFKKTPVSTKHFDSGTNTPIIDLRNP